MLSFLFCLFWTACRGPAYVELRAKTSAKRSYSFYIWVHDFCTKLEKKLQFTESYIFHWGQSLEHEKNRRDLLKSTRRPQLRLPFLNFCEQPDFSADKNVLVAPCKGATHGLCDVVHPSIRARTPGNVISGQLRHFLSNFHFWKKEISNFFHLKSTLNSVNWKETWHHFFRINREVDLPVCVLQMGGFVHT